MESGATPIKCAYSAHTKLFLSFSEGIFRYTTRKSTDEDNRTPPSFPASIKELLKEEHSSETHDEAKALDESHKPVGNIYKICYSSTVKRLGATVEDVTPGIHTTAQYGHSDRGWAGPTTLDGIHTDYLLRKTARSFYRNRDRISP